MTLLRHSNKKVGGARRSGLRDNRPRGRFPSQPERPVHDGPVPSRTTRRGLPRNLPQQKPQQRKHQEGFRRPGRIFLMCRNSTVQSENLM